MDLKEKTKRALGLYHPTRAELVKQRLSEVERTTWRNAGLVAGGLLLGIGAVLGANAIVKRKTGRGLWEMVTERLGGSTPPTKQLPSRAEARREDGGITISGESLPRFANGEDRPRAST